MTSVDCLGLPEARAMLQYSDEAARKLETIYSATRNFATTVYAVSARETDRGYSGREDFWFIVAIRSEDEAEIRAGETAGGSGREGPPACDAPAVLGRGEDPHRARGPAG